MSKQSVHAKCFDGEALPDKTVSRALTEASDQASPGKNSCLPILGKLLTNDTPPKCEKVSAEIELLDIVELCANRNISN